MLSICWHNFENLFYTGNISIIAVAQLSVQAQGSLVKDELCESRDSWEDNENVKNVKKRTMADDGHI